MQRPNVVAVPPPTYTVRKTNDYYTFTLIHLACCFLCGGGVLILWLGVAFICAHKVSRIIMVIVVRHGVRPNSLPTSNTFCRHLILQANNTVYVGIGITIRFCICLSAHASFLYDCEIHSYLLGRA